MGRMTASKHRCRSIGRRAGVHEQRGGCQVGEFSAGSRSLIKRTMWGGTSTSTKPQPSARPLSLAAHPPGCLSACLQACPSPWSHGAEPTGPCTCGFMEPMESMQPRVFYIQILPVRRGRFHSVEKHIILNARCQLFPSLQEKIDRPQPLTTCLR